MKLKDPRRRVFEVEQMLLRVDIIPTDSLMAVRRGDVGGVGGERHTKRNPGDG